MTDSPPGLTLNRSSNRTHRTKPEGSLHEDYRLEVDAIIPNAERTSNQLEKRNMRCACVLIIGRSSALQLELDQCMFLTSSCVLLLWRAVIVTILEWRDGREESL